MAGSKMLFALVAVMAAQVAAQVAVAAPDPCTTTFMALPAPAPAPPNPCTTVTTLVATTVTTTPATTVTTTPAPTCADFKCLHGWTLNANPEKIVGNTVAACCNQNPCTTVTTLVATTVTTTPATTVTTTPAPTLPNPCTTISPGGAAAPQAPAPATAPTIAPNPCTTTAQVPSPRLYNAKQASIVQELTMPEEKASAVPAWAFPFFGVLGMFSCSAFIAMRARRGTRSTREIHVFEPLQRMEENGEPWLTDNAALE